MSNCKECGYFIFEIAEVTPSHEDVLVCACLKKDCYLKDLAPCESFEKVEMNEDLGLSRSPILHHQIRKFITGWKREEKNMEHY